MVVSYNRDFPEAKLPTARLVARLEDWTMDNTANIKLAPTGTMEKSAARFVTYGPAEFNLAADTRQVIRFTINVPKDTPPGDYLLACYIESRNPPPPPGAGGRQLNIMFRYYTMIYVMVPGLTDEGQLADLETKAINGLPIVSPKLENKGNSHLRPMHSVEIRDANDKVVFSSPMAETTVVLGGKDWQQNFPVDVELSAGNYTLKYSVDFQDKKAIQVGKTTFEITGADVALRESLKKKAQENTAQTKDGKPENNPPSETAKKDADSTAAKPAPDAKAAETARTKPAEAATTGETKPTAANSLQPKPPTPSAKPATVVAVDKTPQN